MNGKVVIGCELDMKELEKDLKYSEKELQRFEKEAEKLTQKKAKIEIDLQEYEKQKELIQTSTDETLRFAQTEEQVNNVLSMEETQLEQLNQKYSSQFQKLNEINGQIENNAISQSMFNKKIQETSQKLKQVKGFDKIKFEINNINKGLQNVTKKIGRWGLALFSVYSIYSAVSNAVSILSQYNTQLADNIKYIEFALASTLLPIVQTILNMVVKLLQYINYIVKAWTGNDLFKTADAFKSAQKSASKTVASAKEIKKQLAGFDEMNVLNDSSSSGAGGVAANDIASPSFDLTGIQGEVPGWLTWISNNGETVRRIIEGIAAAILTLKNNLSLLQGVGVFLILDGVVNLLSDIQNYLKDPSLQNLGKIVQDIGEIALGLGLLVGITTPLGLVLAVIGQIGLIIGNLVSLVGDLLNWIKNPSWENFVKIWKDSIGSMGIVGKLILWIFDLFGGFENVVEPFHKFYDWIMQTFIPKFKEDFSKLWEKIKEIFSPVVDFFKNIWDTVSENIKITVDNIKQIFTFLWGKIQEIFGPVVDWFKDKFQTAYDKIQEIFSPIVEFFGGIWDKVKTKLSDFGTKVGEVVGGAFKTVVNEVLKAIERILNSPIKSINKLIDVINKVPGIKLTKLTTFSLPRLAKGGIINQPGRGIPVGSAIAGERGQEGVLPLTDSQQMQLLGEAIGKYVTINANITNTMNGRVISRELKKINNTNDFAFNN